ncbi:MAG: hypothetical protein COA70_11160 [Planctomycetota bacterium]|nr:MAG: hypothetical protein COA70_11160 [Planctomycetota bacterium]
MKLNGTWTVKGRNLFNPKTWLGWDNGYVLKAGQTIEMACVDNDRCYAQFEALKGNVGTGVLYQFGMTCPKSSHNSADGYDGLTGLQKYKEDGTPVVFTFNFGDVNIASWGSSDSLDSSSRPNFGDV